MSQSAQKGQALVIILLVLAVASTVVLSLISRTTTDITITTKEKESARAFSAAEAGVEKALVGQAGGTYPVPGGGGEQYTISVSGVGEGGKEFNSPDAIGAGDVFPVWFVSHDSDGKLTCTGKPCFTGSQMKVCWGEPGTDQNLSTAPAVEVSIIYTASPGDYSKTKVARATYDPNSGRRSSNNFSAPGGSCNIGSASYAWNADVNFDSISIPSNVYTNANGLQTARIRLIYNTDQAQPVGLSVDFLGNSALPSQGSVITSTGVSSSTAGEGSTRKIQVFQLYPDLPPIFDFALFSGGSLSR